MKLIPLSRGLFAMVDDADFDFLNQWKWTAVKSGKTFYAARNELVNGVRRGVKMHRLVIGLTDPAIHVDHRDGNGVNNQRHNLRPCSQPENRRNASIQDNNTSGYKGVSLRKDVIVNKFQARIMVDKKSISLGFFHSPVEAAKAYNDAAILYHGEFAFLNDL